MRSFCKDVLGIGFFFCPFYHQHLCYFYEYTLSKCYITFLCKAVITFTTYAQCSMITIKYLF